MPVYITDYVHFGALDKEKQSYIFNHENRYIKVLSSGNTWKIQVAYLEEDSQRVELELMEKHLEVFIDGLSW